jgi:hypothetical protein
LTQLQHCLALLCFQLGKEQWRYPLDLFDDAQGNVEAQTDMPIELAPCNYCTNSKPITSRANFCQQLRTKTGKV